MISVATYAIPFVRGAGGSGKNYKNPKPKKPFKEWKVSPKTKLLIGLISTVIIFIGLVSLAVVGSHKRPINSNFNTVQPIK